MSVGHGVQTRLPVARGQESVLTVSTELGPPGRDVDPQSMDSRDGGRNGIKGPSGHTRRPRPRSRLRFSASFERRGGPTSENRTGLGLVAWPHQVSNLLYRPATHLHKLALRWEDVAALWVERQMVRAHWVHGHSNRQGTCYP